MPISLEPTEPEPHSATDLELDALTPAEKRRVRRALAEPQIARPEAPRADVSQSKSRTAFMFFILVVALVVGFASYLLLSLCLWIAREIAGQRQKHDILYRTMVRLNERLK